MKGSMSRLPLNIDLKNHRSVTHTRGVARTGIYEGWGWGPKVVNVIAGGMPSGIPHVIMLLPWWGWGAGVVNYIMARALPL